MPSQDLFPAEGGLTSFQPGLDFQCPFLVPCSIHFLDYCWPRNGLPNGFKMNAKMMKIGSIFGTPFLRSWSSSGAYRKPSWTSYDRLGSLRDLRNIVFALKKHTCCRCVSRCFEALDVLLRPVLAPIKPRWSQNGSQRGPENPSLSLGEYLSSSNTFFHNSCWFSVFASFGPLSAMAGGFQNWSHFCS